MHKKRRVSLYSLVAFALVCSIFCALAGCAHTPESEPSATSATNTRELNWQLQGKWISGDGTVSQYQSAAGSIAGTVQLGETGDDILNLSITFSGGCNYQYENPFSYISQIRRHLQVPYCAFPSYAYNQDRNDSVFSYIGISLDEEFVIFHWEDKEDLYLVLSTDPDTDPKDILAYFAVYVNTFTRKK